MAKQYAASAATKIYRGALDAAAAAIVTPIGDVRKFGELPMQVADEYEITTLDQVDPDDASKPDMMKDYAAGHIDPGSLSFTVAFTDDVDTLEGLVGQNQSFKIVFSNAEFRYFNGFIKSIKPNVNEKEDVTFEVTIRVKGKIRSV